MEDADSFFFNCPKYPNTRIALLMQPKSTTLWMSKKLLFGYDNLTVQEDTTIFIAVQNYIKSTERFATE